MTERTDPPAQMRSRAADRAVTRDCGPIAAACLLNGVLPCAALALALLFGVG